MNGDIDILKYITDIQNIGSEPMHIRDRNVDSEGVSMCHWTVGLIKIKILNLRTPIYTVSYEKFTCIRTVTFLNNCINE